MNWAHVVRMICEAYHVLPTEVENLTLDQLYLLTCEVSELKAMAPLATATPQELERMGVISLEQGGGSLVQRIRARNRDRKHGKAARSERKRRRAERIQKLKESRKSQNG